MSFSERAKYTALSIVGIFETSKPLDPAALVVLSDGAGISYGLSQFTHRSGSLKEVVEKYLATDAQAGRPTLDTYVDGMANAANIGSYSRNSVIKAALKAAAKTPEMLAAQVEVATEKYLNPALAACERSGFVLAMTLAVVYDAMNQGGYDVVRDRVTLQASSFPNPTAFERAWTHDFCIERKAWLAASRKSVVRGTIYRPNFFIGQIANGNWDLGLPLTVNGYKLNKLDIPDSSPSPSAVIDTVRSTTGTEPIAATPNPDPPPPVVATTIPSTTEAPAEVKKATAMSPLAKVGAWFTAAGTTVYGFFTNHSEQVQAVASTSTGTQALAGALATFLHLLPYIVPAALIVGYIAYKEWLAHDQTMKIVDTTSSKDKTSVVIT